MKNIAVFGSTGSIGTQALSVCGMHPALFNVKAIVFGSNAAMGIEQIKRFKPEYVGVFEKAPAAAVKKAFPEVKVFTGEDVWSIAALPEIDTVVNGVSGFSGIFPLLSALEAGKAVALANKESVVCAGKLVRAAKERGGGVILPVDSEQSAIFQCLASGRTSDVSSLILTASGGPFRTFSKEELESVTPEMALKHPTWNMGRKVTIDSATLFNKGLELMEAAFLFDMSVDDIRVLVHPQSIIHSMVEFADGCVMAQLSVPDMRIAIQYALTYPERHASPATRLDLAEQGKLTFFEPDAELFPAIELAYEAGREGKTLPTAYNSANEAAVERLVNGNIRFTDIPECVRFVMNRISRFEITGMKELLEADKEARRLAEEYSPRR